MELAYMQIFRDKKDTLLRIGDVSRGVLIGALVEYAFDGVDPEPLSDPVADALWPIFRDMVDQSRRSLEMKSNARKGKAASVSEDNQSKSNGNQNVSESNHSESQPDQNVSDGNQNISDGNQNESNSHIIKESRIKNQESRTTRSNEREARARKAAPDVLSSLAPEVQAAFRDFVAMRVKMRKPMTDRAIALAVGKLLEVAGDDPSAQVAAINRTIEHGWQTFYPDDRPAQTARSGTLQPVKRVNAQQYSQREYTTDQLDGLFEVLS